MSCCDFTYVPFNPKFGAGVIWLVDRWSHSWASHTHHTADVSDDEVEATYRWWVDVGSPAADRWRFTVTPDDQRVELN